MENLGATIIIGLIVFIVLFLVLREVMCWYYKINERLATQQETNRLLVRLLNDAPKVSAPISVSPSQGSRKAFCTECGKQHIDSSNHNCVHCGAVIR